MRPDIMPISSFQALNVAGLLTTSATMRAPCTGGVGVHRAGDALQLGEHVGGGLLRVEHGTQGAHAFAVEAQVLGVALAAQELDAALREEAGGEGVLHEVPGGEALVGHVEERQVPLLHADVRDRRPLLGGGVHPRGVVRAPVQHNHAALGRRLDVPDHALEVQADGLGVAAIVAHCSGVGSTPVGLCAHPCSTITLPSGAALMSRIMPSKSRPMVSGSK